MQEVRNISFSYSKPFSFMLDFDFIIFSLKCTIHSQSFWQQFLGRLDFGLSGLFDSGPFERYAVCFLFPSHISILYSQYPVSDAGPSLHSTGGGTRSTIVSSRPKLSIQLTSTWSKNSNLHPSVKRVMLTVFQRMRFWRLLHYEMERRRIVLLTSK